MRTSTQIINWLSDYQTDLLKIIRSHRHSSHRLSDFEILSEFNIRFIKQSKKIALQNFTDYISFCKFSYKSVLNVIRWTAVNTSTEKRRNSIVTPNYILNVEGDSKTLYDYACDCIGEEDPNFVEIFREDKCKMLLKWIFKYSTVLTDRQKHILALRLKGYTADEIGDKLGISHQSVFTTLDWAEENIRHKILHQFNDDFYDQKMHQGHKAIKYLFSQERKKSRAKV